MKRELLAQVPAEWRTLPGVAHELANAMLAQGRPGDAAGLLQVALGAGSDPVLGQDLLLALVEQQKFGDADRVMNTLIDRGLPGLSWSTLTLALANGLLDAGRRDAALSWARQGKKTRAAWAYTGHARIALAVDQPKEALASIDAAIGHYGANEEFTRLKALHRVIESRGKEGVSDLDATLQSTLPSEADDVAKVLDGAWVQLPAGDLSEKLAFALQVNRIAGARGAPEPPAVLALVARSSGPGDVKEWCRVRLVEAILPLLARSLWRGGSAGQARPFSDQELKELIDLVSPRRMPAVQALLHVMAALGADDAQLVAALQRLSPGLAPAEQAVARVLARGPRLAAWLAVTRPTTPFESNLAQTVGFRTRGGGTPRWRCAATAPGASPVLAPLLSEPH
jgi:hypothetical protein